MGDVAEDLAKAHDLPEGDVIRLLLEQHARIRQLFDSVIAASGEERQARFDELRALLAVHETAEEMVLRPVSAKAAGQEVVDARNREEAEANEVLLTLESLDVDSADFETRFVAFHKTVDEHAEAEEHDEFPGILAACDADERRTLGDRVRKAEAIAPTHPHPSAAGSTTKQMVMGPFASIVDRVRDALGKAG
jgi:hemerythrin superfamily protein